MDIDVKNLRKKMIGLRGTDIYDKVSKYLLEALHVLLVLIWVLKIAIISLIESKRNDPEKYSALVYHNNDNQNSLPANTTTAIYWTLLDK